MKKLLVVCLLVLGAVGVFAQKGRPCVDEYKQDRTLSEMREILMMDGPYYDNLRIAYAEAINYNIGKMVIYSSKKGISELLDNTIFMQSTFVNPAEFQNGVRYGNTVKFTNLAGQPSEYYAAMHYEGKDYIYAKVACINPQKAKKRGVFEEQKSEQTPPPSSEAKTETGSTGNHDVPDHGVKKQTSNNDNVNTTVSDLGKKHKKTREEKTWVGKNWWWAGPLVAGIITGGVIGAKKLLKKGTTHQAHMSGGFGDENTKTTTTTTGGNVGNGSGFGN